VLSASTGEWSGAPVSYDYQWLACEVNGECIDLPEATESTYVLISPEVGFTIRVQVTAVNAAGSATATSAETQPVTEPPPPPTLNTALPKITGTAIVGQLLKASTGEWSGAPTSYSYEWQSCSELGQCAKIVAASGSSYALTAADVAHTIRVLVTAEGPGGSATATSEQTLPVTEPPPPPTLNTALPKIIGTAIVGQQLKASTGEWSGAPTSYSYEWQSCSAPAVCAKIAAASGSAYTLTAAEVAHTIRVLVTAEGPGGSATAASEETAAVVGESETVSGAQTDCFGREEACGYPGPNNTGADCPALTPSGSLTISKAGETVEGKDITGKVVVDAPNVTFNNDCVEYNGEEHVGANAITTESGAGNFKISNSTVRGLNTTSESIEAAIANDSQNAGDVATKDRFENCGTCIYYSWTVNESYVNNDGLRNLTEAAINHAEDWYISDSTISANDDTMYNPAKQVAVIFAQVANGTPCSNHETVTNSLLGGGGYIFYFCSHSSGNEGSTIDIKDNRFARLVCTKHEYQYEGGYECEGGTKSYFGAGEGSGGYFPRGGFFGVLAESEGLFEQGSEWEGNYWDNNLEAQPEQVYCPKCK
jgi:hypothetical protein